MVVYCPYTDQELDEIEVNREHILPLSLGGIDGFEILVSKEFNSKAGSKIDGALANEFFIKMKRNELDVRGHSNKRPVVTVKASQDVSTGNPVQVKFDKHDGMKIFCPLTNSYLTGEKKVQISLSMDMDIGLKFVAKTALSAGYFVYGDIFKNQVEHDEIRFIMNHDLKNPSDAAQKIRTRIDDNFRQVENADLEVIRVLCRMVTDSSIVGFVPGPSNIIIFVGILGHYIGMLNVPANTEGFPKDGAYDLGHVITPQNGNLVRISFRRAIEKLKDVLEQAGNN